MAEQPALPFHSFTFTLLENRKPRKSLRMVAQAGGLYELAVQQGSAANPSSQVTRIVPLETAVRLRDVLQSVGAFGWDESYGDAAAPGSRRWAMAVVFEEGVFSLESKGGSDVPPGFDDLLEELYRMDFPRPAAQRASALPASSAQLPSSIGDAAAFASQLGGMPGVDAAAMQRMMAQAGADPEALARQVKDGFSRLSPAEQSQMLDALAATGLAPREWWERFFRDR